MVVVLDAPAAVEILLRTPVGRRALEYLEPNDVVSPELLDAEVLSAVRGQVLGRKLAAGRAQEALSDLRSLPIARLTHRPLLERAFELRGILSAYDALYVATAQVTNGLIVTVDRKLARARLAGVRVIDLTGKS